MAYEGYLLKVGNTIFNLDWIKYDTYSVTPNIRQDKDSYEDCNGVLHRNVLPHRPSKIEFETRVLDNTQAGLIMSTVKSAWTNIGERKLSITFWNPEENGYTTADAYMPDIQWKIMDADNTKLRYRPARICFICY